MVTKLVRAQPSRFQMDGAEFYEVLLEHWYSEEDLEVIKDNWQEIWDDERKQELIRAFCAHPLDEDITMELACAIFDGIDD